jgi:uncharacterized protein YbgA (DUF1722 family)/uncharacterized protein YbbK (DUF523 family)
LVERPLKPILVLSKCIECAACRYNGQTIPSKFVRQLRAHVEFIPVCPECEIGLGIPRDPVRVVEQDGEYRLMQTKTERDVTQPMREFAEGFLSALPDIDGFILKSRSPSCGIKEVKVYSSIGKVPPKGKHHGFFGAAVIERFPSFPLEDEGRLKNFIIRGNFLTRVFTLARFRKVVETGSASELVTFHSRNKYLIMAYNQERMRELGRIAANHDKKPWPEVIANYGEKLREVFPRTPSAGSYVNVLQHTMGYFSEYLTAREKQFFLALLKKYRKGKVPMGVLFEVMRSWVVRFEEEYLTQQTLFEPYPEELLDVTDFGKGRSV